MWCAQHTPLPSPSALQTNHSAVRSVGMSSDKKWEKNDQDDSINLYSLSYTLHLTMPMQCFYTNIQYQSCLLVCIQYRKVSYIPIYPGYYIYINYHTRYTLLGGSILSRGLSYWLFAIKIMIFWQIKCTLFSVTKRI